MYTEDIQEFSFKRYGFSVRVIAEVDPDLSYERAEELGQYTDRPDESGGMIVDRKHRGDMGYHSCRYWVPKENTYNDHYSGLKDFSKHQRHELAKHYVMQDYVRAEDYNSNEWCVLYVTVEVYYNGRVMGEGNTDIESDGDDRYVAWSVRDAVTEALRDAQAHINSIAAEKLQPGIDRLVKVYARYRRMEDHKDRPVTDKRLRFRQWRDLSLPYQKNSNVTRHVLKRYRATSEDARRDYNYGRAWRENRAVGIGRLRIR